jgi:drug/metabolite transporter (DMT)-like permease
VSTAILIEYLAPLLLVAFVWATTRTMPRAVVLIGSVAAIAGLFLVVGLGAASSGPLDPLGLIFAALSAVGCAVYYVIAARPSDGFPPVAYAATGLLLGGVVLAVIGLVGLVPFTASFGSVNMFGGESVWWAPLLFVAVVSTAIPYWASITASEMLGSRLMSFVGLLEVIFASMFAWVLLGETHTIVQLVGGALILTGIAFVRSERQADASLEPGSREPMGPIATEVFEGRRAQE